MSNKINQSENIIRGSCADFVCRCCLTKYGWEHQKWCDCGDLLNPECQDCIYYNLKRRRCNHPTHSKQKRRDAG